MREYNGKVYVEKAPHDVNELLEIVKILRGPNGCSWDGAQTLDSMKTCLINESQEVIDAIDKKDYENLCEELGDLLLQVVMNAEIASETDKFDFSAVVQTVCEKLIRRHPHVFGDVKRPNTPEESLALWKSVKQKEKEEKSKKTPEK